MRSLVCSVIGIVAVIFLWTLAPTSEPVPKGIFLPAQKTVRAPISAQSVSIFQEAPSGNYIRLGQIRAEMAFKNSHSKAQAALLQYVKNVAAKHGANGVIVNVLVPDTGVQQAYTFIGTAVHVPSDTANTQGAQ